MAAASCPPDWFDLLSSDFLKTIFPKVGGPGGIMRVELEDAIAAWREHCIVQKGQQLRGVDQYQRVIVEFFAWVESRGMTASPEFIARDHVTEWQRAIFYERGNVSNRTRASKLSALRSFFGFLRFDGRIDRDPTKGIPSPKVQPNLAKKFTTEELNRMFSAPDISTPMGVRDLAILMTLYAAGPRVSELVGLDLNHIHDTGGYIRIEILDGKGGKSRAVTLRTHASQPLRQWLLLRREIDAQHNGVFVSLRAAPTRLSARRVQDILKKYARLVGIDSVDAFCHKMRSTFATDLYDSGHDCCPRCGQVIQYVGIAELSALMGHEDPKTTMGYIAISERVLRRTAIPDKRLKEIINCQEGLDVVPR